MSKIEAVCVYCGASSGSNDAYMDAARQLGTELAKADIRLVYGGGSTGLMGAVADAVLAAGGKVTGIIPQFLADREVMHKQVTKLIVTDDMHERKRKMFEHADAFVALPGGIGTLEELIEMLTWAQLGQHQKPVLLANVDGFWEHLSALLDHMRQNGFIPGDRRVGYLETGDVTAIIPKLQEAATNLSRAELDRTADTGDISKM